MDEVPLSVMLALLGLLLAVSGFFSIAETVMVASNRLRLAAQAREGRRGAQIALSLLANTDRLLGTILLGNNLINAAAATLTAVIVTRLFGQGELALALGTVAVTFGILVFSEITPKVIGAAYAERLAPYVAFALVPLIRGFRPVVWFVNLFVRGLLALMRLEPAGESGKPLSHEELRLLVLEGSRVLPAKPRSILANVFEVSGIEVDDVMIPRHRIDAIDLDAGVEAIRAQLAKTYHTRLPVYRGQPDEVVGILHVRSVLTLWRDDSWTVEDLLDVVRPPYFIPSGTPLLAQLQHFQENRQRMGLVVDEYGELLGLVTLEDLVEELIGEFTTNAPGGAANVETEPGGTFVVNGNTSLRILNRRLGTDFPLEGPRTLNGLALEHLGEIPEPGMSFRVGDYSLEVLSVQDRTVKRMRIRPLRPAEDALQAGVA